MKITNQKQKSDKKAGKRLQKKVKDKNGKKLVEIKSSTSNICKKNMIQCRVNKCF